MVRRVILRCRLALGDLVMLTGVVRDLHLHHPCRFLTDVRTSYPDVWQHNPLLTPLRTRDPGVETIDCDALADVAGERAPLHCAQAVAAGLARRLGIPFFPTLAGGDIALSPEERERPSAVARRIGRPVPYWIIVAGGKRDAPVKWWDAARYQEVVDRLAGRILFVQVGAANHEHPPLSGVLDFRGRTSVRDLVHLVHHAQGVLCGITSLMHLAAAVETPTGPPARRACVVVAGGREAPYWAAYPTHRFLHNVGTLECCAESGCWRSRVQPTPGVPLRKELPHLCLDVVDGLPHCMELIPPATVVARVEDCFAGGRLPLLDHREFERIRPLLARSRPSRMRRAPAAGGVVSGRNRGDLDGAGEPPVTICVCTYGDHLAFVKRCLESIRPRCARNSYRLAVGGNEVSPAVREYLRRLRGEGAIDRLHLSPVNLNKSPMMRRLFADVRTEFVWWFDDDVEVVDPGALEVRLFLAREASRRTVLWGDLYTCDLDRWQDDGIDVRAWIRGAAWYRGRPIGARRWSFPTGANWFVRTAALRAMDWPDPRLVLTAEDVLLGEAIRQQGWSMVDVGRLGIRVWPEASRGPDRHDIMRRQMETRTDAP